MILYKYVPCDKYAKENLKESQLRFSTPENFNDPFDIYPQFDVKAERESMLTLFKREQQAKFGLEYQTAVDDLSDEEILNIFHQTYNRNDATAKQGITCFSKDRDNMLMWSHYADKHSGICLGFEFDVNDEHLEKFFDDSKNFKIPFNSKACKLIPINYVSVNDRPKFTFKDVINSSEENFMYKIMSTKYDMWKEEHEVRIMVHGGNQKIFPTQLHYKTENLKEIIFGTRTSLKNVVTIYNVMKNFQTFNEIAFRFSTLSCNNYALNIVSIASKELNMLEDNYNKLYRLTNIGGLQAIKELNLKRKTMLKCWQKALDKLNLSDISLILGNFLNEDIADYISDFCDNHTNDSNLSHCWNVSMFVNTMVELMKKS